MPRHAMLMAAALVAQLVACAPFQQQSPDDGGPDAAQPGPDAAAFADATAPSPDAALAGPDAALVGPDGALPGPDAGPGPQPGDQVVWLTLPTQNSRTGAGWGAVLTDIVRHCPDAWVDWYVDSDRVTHGHETTHGVHAFLRNDWNTLGVPANGFYVLGDQAALVAEPGISKSQVAPYVPTLLRGFRFDTYVTGQSAWDDTPLYLWDEWVAYTNGTAVAMDLYNAGQWTYGWRDACSGTVEFVPYALAVGLAVEALDPTYFAQNLQFRQFLAWHLRRSLELFRACRGVPDFAWSDQDQLYLDLRTHADAAPLRDFLVRTYGQAFHDAVLLP